MERRTLLSVGLLADIDSAPSGSVETVEFNGNLYFVASDPQHGYELWKSDGTAAGTAMVKDINPGAASSAVSHLTVANGLLYFAATDGPHGMELWRSDGSASGTVMVKDIYAGAESSSPESLVAYNGQLYFAATNPTSGREIWKSNGTAVGTVLMLDASPGSYSSGPRDFTVAGTKLYFTAIYGSFNYLWSSNGTSAGSTKLATDVFDMAAVGSTLFYQNASGGLSKTNGTVAGTQLVSAINPGGSGYIGNMTNVNGTLFFAADDGVHGRELWRSDGTAAGTAMVADISPGSNSGVVNPNTFASAGGRVFFVARAPGSDFRLWQSDGTGPGTVPVVDELGSWLYWPSTVTAANGAVYFNDDSELWRTDGTAAGTIRLADTNVISGSPFAVTAFGTSVYFMSPEGSGSLWKTDGTPAGTARVVDLRLPSSGGVTDLTPIGPITYFAATRNGFDSELWRTDGTAAGTMLVKDIDPLHGSYPSTLTNFNGTLLFFADDGTHGSELWRSDGTADGTIMLKDINPGSPDATRWVPTAVVGDLLYFVANDGVAGAELWKSDGTTAGTVRVKDINPGPGNSGIGNLTAVGDLLYFTANDGSHGTEVWKSNGTPAGTVMVKDITPGAAGTTFAWTGGLVECDGRLVFAADDGAHGMELWASDGTAAGTAMLADINPGAAGALVTSFPRLTAYKDRIYFGAVDGSGVSRSLWSTDGTSTGTSLFYNFTPSGSVDNFALFGDRLVINVFSSSGSSLWITDGTPAGLRTIFAPGAGPLFLSWGTADFGGNLYFWGDDSLHGMELWMTDGTAAGTSIVTDARPGRGDTRNSGQYTGLVVNGNHLFFSPDDGMTGAELWSVLLPPAVVTQSAVPEGSTVVLNAVPAGAILDPLDPTTYSWDLDNDGVFGETGANAARGDEVGPTPTFSAAGLDGPLAWPVAVRGTNSTGVNLARGSVTVTNASPVVALDTIPTSAIEGGPAVHLSGSATDLPADADAGIQLAWSVSRNGTVVATGTGPAIDFPPIDSGTYVVLLTATDKDGGSSTASGTLVIGNVAPSATLPNANAIIDTQATVALTNPFDPSSADVAAGFRYSFDLNNDGTFEIVDSASPMASTVFSTLGRHTVRAIIRDKDGGATTYTASVFVSLPTRPTTTFTGAGFVNEGSTRSVTFGPVSGAGPFTYSYDFDGDGTFDILDSPAASAAVPAAYLADGPSLCVVVGRVTDKYGQYTDYAAAVAVRNVSPTIVIPAAANGSVVLGNDFLLSLSTLDPGKDKVTGWHIDWGDGRSSDVAGASGLFPHAYSAAGTFTVTATATDEDGSYSASTRAVVSATPPTATFAAGSLAPDGSAYRFTVTYADDLGIDATSLGDGDFLVTGPAGTAQARLVSYVPATDGHGGVATYDVPSPLGTWAWQDNGTYTVSARTGEVRDLQGIDLPAGTVGAFAVDLIPPTAPDLFPQFSGTLPKTLTPGAKYSVAVKVSNRGTKNMATTNVTTRLLLSADPVADAGDLVLGSAVRSLGLRLNASTAVTVAFPSPKLSAGGKYYLLAVTDATNAVAERDERNNVAASVGVTLPASTVDLATTFSAKPKSTYQPGNSIGFGLRVANAGNVDASGPATLRLYFSTDSILDDGDMLAATSVLPLKLKAKASAVFNRTIKVPAPLAGRKWYLLAAVDGTAVGDHSPSNNIARSGPFVVAGRA